MAVEALAWPSPPTLTDAVDGTQSYNMGVAFTVSTSQQCPGVQWRVPDTLAPPSVGAYAIILYDDAANTRLAYKEFTPVAGGYQNVLFDSVVTLPAGTYVVTVYTLHYVFRSGSPSGVSTPSGAATAVEGRLSTYNGGAASAPMPTGAVNSIYYVSPLIDTGGVTGVTPTGIAVPVSPGSPTAAVGLSAGPTGIAVPVAAGSPSTTPVGASPAGIAVGVSLGTPSTAYTLSTIPAGISVPVHLGSPSSQVAVAVSAPGPVIRTTARERTLHTTTLGS